jgi:hypothetical protein
VKEDKILFTTNLTRDLFATQDWCILMLKAGSKIVAKFFYSAIVDEGFLETDLHNSKHRPTNAVVRHEHDASGISQCELWLWHYSRHSRDPSSSILSFLRPYIERHTGRWRTLRELQLASSFVERNSVRRRPTIADLCVIMMS